MAEYNDLKRPLDDLGKSELEELKLKTEIIKLRFEVQEKNKSWFIKNLAILIPSFIGICTLLTGYLTGYFNVQSVRLENQKHDLVAQIDSFTQKKDILNKKNDSLLERQILLESNFNKMKRDTTALSSAVKNLRERNNNLANQNKNLSAQEEDLQAERNNLSNNINKLKSDVNHAAFNEYFINLTRKPDYGYEYDHLLILMTKKGDADSYYLQTIKHSIDSTQDMLLKAVLLRLLYAQTSDINWRKKLHIIADNYCDSLLVKRNNFSSFNRNNFLNTLNIIFERKDTLEELAYIEKTLLKLSSANNNNEYLRQDIANLLEHTTDLFSVSKNSLYATQQELLLFKKDPEHFCFFLNFSIQACLKDTGILLHGEYSFIEKFAPIGFAALISEMIVKAKKIDKRINQFILFHQLQLSLYDLPRDISATNLWRDWQNKHSEIVDITLNINSYCSDNTKILKIVGRSFF